MSLYTDVIKTLLSESPIDQITLVKHLEWHGLLKRVYAKHSLGYNSTRASIQIQHYINTNHLIFVVRDGTRYALRYEALSIDVSLYSHVYVLYREEEYQQAEPVSDKPVVYNGKQHIKTELLNGKNVSHWDVTSKPKITKYWLQGLKIVEGLIQFESDPDNLYILNQFTKEDLLDNYSDIAAIHFLHYEDIDRLLDMSDDSHKAKRDAGINRDILPPKESIEYNRSISEMAIDSCNQTDIYEMDLHTFIQMDKNSQVVRVPGGWIYHSRHYIKGQGYQVTSNFVPYNKEFYPAITSGCMLCGHDKKKDIAMLWHVVYSSGYTIETDVSVYPTDQLAYEAYDRITDNYIWPRICEILSLNEEAKDGYTIHDLMNDITDPQRAKLSEHEITFERYDITWDEDVFRRVQLYPVDLKAFE